jgi:TPP-dependent pyruvate/acetoin dehydrogenase alpha subunit
MKTEAEEKEIREENRKIRYLRFLVDFSILSIQQDDLLFEEAQGIVENVKRAACSLFPEKEETFELIYRPRFNRVIRERFGFSRESGGSESI